MLAQSCDDMAASVMNSTNEHEAGMRCFSMVQFGKNMLIRYYSGTLLYANLYDAKDFNRRYGEGLISVSLKEFHTYAIHVHSDVKYSVRRGHQ